MFTSVLINGERGPFASRGNGDYDFGSRRRISTHLAFGRKITFAVSNFGERWQSGLKLINKQNKHETRTLIVIF